MKNKKQCNCCHDFLPLTSFPVCSTHTKKNGEVTKYYRDTCKACFRGKERDRSDCVKNRRFNRLVSWAVAAFLVMVTGIYSHDYVKARTRTCFYESIYGTHAVTIDALTMCPVSMEFEV